MNITNATKALGPGASIAYVGKAQMAEVKRAFRETKGRTA